MDTRTDLDATASSSVTEVTHPLVQHKLGLLRDVTTTTQMFRQLVNELTLLLTYEATKDLADEEVEIETPLEHMAARRISGKKVAVCPILRAGMGMLDAVLSLVPGARVGFIGLFRDEETLEPVEYYVKLPDDLSDRDVILLDPMLATGNSTAAAVETVKRLRRDLRTAHRADRRAGGHRARAPGAPGRAHRRRLGRSRPEREGVHPPGPRRRRRPAVRDEVGERVRRAAGDAGGHLRSAHRVRRRGAADPGRRRHGADARRGRPPGRAPDQPAPDPSARRPGDLPRDSRAGPCLPRSLGREPRRAPRRGDRDRRRRGRRLPWALAVREARRTVRRRLDPADVRGLDRPRHVPVRRRARHSGLDRRADSRCCSSSR